MLFDQVYLRTIFTMAYPVVLGMISRTLMTLVDTAMVGRIGPSAVAAIGVGGLVLWIIYSVFFALSVALQAIVSRRYGEKRYDECGQTLNTLFSMSVLFGCLLTGSGVLYGHHIFPLLVSDHQVIIYGNSYLKVRFLEGISFLLTMVFRGFFNGIGATKIFMNMMIISNICNVFLNYLLIYGNWGFPRLEVAGAAIATTISTYIGVVIFILYALLPHYRKRYRLFQIKDFNPAILYNLVHLFWPAALRYVLVNISSLMFLKIMGMVGTLELAATNIVLSILSLAWMPGYGIGVASAALIGQSLGAGNPQQAEKYGWESMKLGIVFMGTLSLLFLAVPGFFMRIFTNDPLVISHGIKALEILSLILFFDAVSIILSECLEGAGQMFFVMCSEIGISWIFCVPGAYVFSIKYRWGITGGWLGVAAYSLLFAILMIYKFREGSWKNIEV